MGGWFRTEEYVPVEHLECHCPGTPHPDGDTFWLRTQLSPEGAIAASQTLNEPDADELQARLGWAYVVYGVARWTLVDENGKDIPCTRENVRLLNWETVYPVAQAASEMGYSEELFRPLVASRSRSSRNGQTVGSTSAKKRSSTSRRKH